MVLETALTDGQIFHEGSGLVLLVCFPEKKKTKKKTQFPFYHNLGMRKTVLAVKWVVTAPNMFASVNRAIIISL